MAGFIDKIKGMFGGKSADGGGGSALDSMKDAAGKVKDQVDDLVDKAGDKVPDSVKDNYDEVSDKVEDVIPGDSDDDGH